MKTRRTQTRVVDPDEPLFNSTFRSSYRNDPMQDAGILENIHGADASLLGDAERDGVFHFRLAYSKAMPGRWDRSGTASYATDEYNGYDSPEDDWN